MFVACSVGNGWPLEDSVVNTVPWIMTLAAGFIDRSFSTSITMNIGRVLNGHTLYVILSVKSIEMISTINVRNYHDSLSFIVQGKIGVC